MRIRQVFEQRDQEETALFVSQFQREFQHRSAEVAAAVDRMAASERVRTMAFELTQSGDASPYLTEAQTLAQDAQLDFLEIVGPDGKIVSSAQWPARFGYRSPSRRAMQATFLKTGRSTGRNFGARPLRRSSRRAFGGRRAQAVASGGRQAPRPGLPRRSARRSRNADLALQRCRPRRPGTGQPALDPDIELSIPGA